MVDKKTVNKNKNPNSPTRFISKAVIDSDTGEVKENIQDDYYIVERHV